MDENGKPKAMGQVIQIDEARIRDRLGEMVRGTVEEALNAMLDAERLPAGAGRIGNVLFQVLKYDVLGDGAVGG